MLPSEDHLQKERMQLILPWANMEETQPWTEDWQQKENMGISVEEAWGARWERLRDTWGKRKDHSTKRKTFYRLVQVLLHHLECIWGRGGCESLPWVVMSLSWTPLVLQFFIHSSIHLVLTKHLLTTQANTRVVTEMKKKLFKITTESSSQTHHPRRSFLVVVSLRVGHPEDRPRKAEGLSSGHTPALSLKCLPNLPNSTQTMKMTWWFVDSQAHQETFPLSCSN